MFNAMTLLIGWIDSLDVFDFGSVLPLICLLLQLFVWCLLFWKRRSHVSKSLKDFILLLGRIRVLGVILLCFSMEDSLITTKFSWMWFFTNFNCCGKKNPDSTVKKNFRWPSFLSSMHWKGWKDLEAFVCARRKQPKSLALCSAYQLLMMHCVGDVLDVHVAFSLFCVEDS